MQGVFFFLAVGYAVKNRHVISIYRKNRLNKKFFITNHKKQYQYFR